ncbi:ABC transporter permease [Sansalvadorimonas sp. 2012CJ34-2]|uniref:Transport permease protein n=1 Tax=Parendozoicomonas callyspongiae TaxID=2942213 RepID=A0ABT0PIC8_9GAMM|nr:ABC transporter permease [Sansalvadorimonas sp. 2012CJ34-2]MCL6271110.1 ABC transporter permease [Sansalvadorimonas sp. 2012CJ34-2]
MGLQQNWIAFCTIFFKEVRRFMRIWPQTLLPPAITMSLYFVIFGSVIGSRIGTMGGFDYMTFVVPGLVMMSVITNSYSNVSSSFYSNKFQKSVEELLVSPVPNWIILAGYVLGGVARGLMTACIVIALSLFFVDFQVYSLLATILAVLLTSLMFALGGFLNALFARSFDDVSIIPTFVLTPLTYLGGVFYSVKVLPDFWRGVSQANPILYQVNAFRYGMLGYSGVVDLDIAFSIMAIAVAVLFVVCLHLLNTGKGLRS